MAFKVPEGTTRFNAYIKTELVEKMKIYCDENYMSQTGFINMVLKQYFEGQEALKNMGSVTELLKTVSELASKEEAKKEAEK